MHSLHFHYPLLTARKDAISKVAMTSFTCLYFCDTSSLTSEMHKCRVVGSPMTTKDTCTTADAHDGSVMRAADIRGARKWGACFSLQRRVRERGRCKSMAFPWGAEWSERWHNSEAGRMRRGGRLGCHQHCQLHVQPRSGWVVIGSVILVIFLLHSVFRHIERLCHDVWVRSGPLL